ncbi:hypothetical protein RR48_10020 [Papilio machaon]|uniref:Elongator complex protein 5 n=1 Tax=Papilio machaon TaxID=76193 RepID=A0A194RET6_PAPMA|nr:elongator complex protein 5 [Papilio machaon]KPJ15974.1 hypothetical protein RR48_10020 [Papilio machaon]
MTLLKLRSAPVVLIEDDYNINILPLVTSLVEDKLKINLFSYEQSIKLWEKVFQNQAVEYYQEFDPESYIECIKQPCHVFIDSVTQMSMHMGWHKCLTYIRKLKSHENVVKLILVLHKDCIQMHSKLQKHLMHLAHATITYSENNPFQIAVQIKLGNKFVKTEELLSYDNITSMLKCERITKEVIKDEEPAKPNPGNLTTFKIEVDQTQQLEKHNLKLPYMSKINEGKSKVYYEPDAVDDWDEEDPDEDLDI